MLDLQQSIQFDAPIVRSTIDEAFWRFHEANPHIFRHIVRLCNEARDAGFDQWSINGIFEVLRWQTALRTDEEKPKLSNSYRALYARLVMETYPHLDGFFVTKERPSLLR